MTLGVGPHLTWSWGLTMFLWNLAAMGVAAAAWVLFVDPAKKRRRCPRCWYEMDAVPGLVCPECGKDAGSEKGLHRTRRRHGLAVLALAVSLAPAAAPTWRFVAEERFWPWMPRSVLIQALPWACANRVYWREFEGRVIEEKYSRDDSWSTGRVVYRPRSMSRGELVALRARIEDALLATTPGAPRGDLLEMARQLGVASARLDGIVLSSLNDPDPRMRTTALAIARQRKLPQESVLTAVLAMCAPAGQGQSLFGDEQFLAEAAAYLGEAGASDPRVVPALMQLWRAWQAEYGGTMGMVPWNVRENLLRAFAALGPAAAEAAPMLRTQPGDDWGGGEPLQLYAYWVVNGDGDRCKVLGLLLGQSEWRYRDFAAEEMGKAPACPDVVATLENALDDRMHWVRNNAAMSLMRLGHASGRTREILLKDAAENFDAFSMVMAFATERGLDPAPLEAMIPAFRRESRVPEVTVDNAERRLREYREQRATDEPFVDW